MKYVVIFYDALGKCRQVVRPTRAFNSDWHGLVHGITNGVYHHYEIIN